MPSLLTELAPALLSVQPGPRSSGRVCALGRSFPQTPGAASGQALKGERMAGVVSSGLALPRRRKGMMAHRVTHPQGHWFEAQTRMAREPMFTEPVLSTRYCAACLAWTVSLLILTTTLAGAL